VAEFEELDERVTLTTVGGIATITLVREARMNAFDEAMHQQLRVAVAEVASEPSIKVLVLTGRGRAFSSGQDLGERAAAFVRSARCRVRCPSGTRSIAAIS